jgi:hypothetical protein
MKAVVWKQASEEQTILKPFLNRGTKISQHRQTGEAAK